MSIEVILILFFGLLFAGVPIAFVMLTLSFLYFALGPNPLFLALLPEKIFEGIDVIILTAIPFFLLAGELMNKSGMAERLMHFSNLLVGRFRGGLAQVNILASLLFSGLSGVAVGDIAALGKIEVHAMERHGYKRAFAAAVTVASSIVGPIIPPSGIIILYCAIMNVSVGGMFAAALLPGLLMALADMLLVGVMARRRNFPRETVPLTPRSLALGAKDAALALLMPVVMIGGIVGGIMTPTEAAAVSVAYALFVGAVIYRGLTTRAIWRITGNSAFEAARLLFMIGCAMTMTWIFALEGLPAQVSALFTGLELSPWLLILVINLLFIVMGMFLDSALALLLFAPVVAPLAYSAGMHPFQLGIMLVLNVTVGLATPPVGNVLFAITSVVRLDVRELIRELMPFLIIKFILILLVGWVPSLSMTIPAALGFK